ncbi:MULTISPECIES: lactococcin 972 family bacteriocin [unclassified Streptococcus]|uniref:lactococcin 972 family bacteriocin n=1 Tax=unclassified Streptococcus TaxID=2608887 RepID=UPI00359CD472
MKKIKNALYTCILAGAIVISSGLIASAVEVDGGTWNYGYGTFYTYSNYYHSHNKHGAKVVNRNNGAKNWANAGSGVWAYSSIGNVWDPASFYYHPVNHYDSNGNAIW